MTAKRRCGFGARRKITVQPGSISGRATVRGLTAARVQVWMARVLGIGGIFLRARDPAALGAWYKRHLGIPYDGGFANLSRAEDPHPDADTIWAPFDFDTTYFGPDQQQAMLNFRVADLDALIADLVAGGVEIVPERSEDPTGRFAWIVDCEGNRIELWEPPNAGPRSHRTLIADRRDESSVVRPAAFIVWK